ncbi:MAG: hypothetical protein WC294_04980 [Methanoregula sp.]|jgi:hypothetical protein
MDEAEIQKKIDEAIKGLKEKNTELLGKLKKAGEVVDKVKDLDIDSLLAAKTELETLKSKSDEEKGEYKKLYETLKVEKDTVVADLIGKIKDKESKIITMVKKNSVVAAIIENKLSIPGPLMNIAVDNIMADVAVDDTGNAKVGDKTVNDFVKEWAMSDIGKHFVASGNSGGGANGGAGEGESSWAKFFDKKSPHYNLTEQAKLAKTNIDLYNRLKQKQI